MTSDELRHIEWMLADVAGVAGKLFQAAKKAADKSDHTIVPRERYALLEQLFEAAVDMESDCAMTRDYKDAIEQGKVKYLGKKYLLDRNKYEQFCEIKARVKASRKATVQKGKEVQCPPQPPAQ